MYESLQTVSNSNFAVGWFTLALINTGLAQSKNFSGFGWFLISLLLGPIATFIIVIRNSRRSGTR